MKKLIIIVALTITAIAGHYINITKPDGTVMTCYVYDNGDMQCW